jgi:hypothetical protein|tara:strand:- start:2722 stop:2898 length:177 start_codon:yes stop_codon:yes gene_type:complete
MSLNQFFITFAVALVLGLFVSKAGKLLFKRALLLYRTLTFRHVILTPYTPKKQKKDNK